MDLSSEESTKSCAAPESRSLKAPTPTPRDSIDFGRRLSRVSPYLVTILGPLIVVFRLCHAYGLSMHFGPGSNGFRAIGAGGTALAIIVLSAACLIVAVPPFR